MPRRKGKPKKAINGQGTLTQLDNGKWEYRYTMPIPLANGKPDRRSRTRNTAEEAFAFGQSEIAEARKMPQVKVAANELTTELLIEKWWSVHKDEVRGSTLSTDKYTKKRIIAGFGKMLAGEVRPPHVAAYVQTQKAAGKSNSSISKDRGMLFQVFAWGLDEGLVGHNPVTQRRRMKKSKKVKLIVDKNDAFLPDEVEQILEAQRKLSDMRGSKKVRMAIIQAAEATVSLLFSGLRESEMLLMPTTLVAEDGRAMSVVGALNIVDGKSEPGDAKSQAAIRRAAVSTVAHPVVKRLRDTSTNGLMLRSYNPKAPYYSGSAFRKAYYSFLDRYVPGVRRLSPHKCRHTHATMLAAVGVPPAIIREQMGHEDYKLTASIYTHVKLYMTPEAIKKVKSWGVGDFLKEVSLEIVGDSDKSDGKTKTTEPA